MANYTTSAGLQARFGPGEVAYLTKSYPTVNEAVITDCLESAESDINSRIGSRYNTGASLVTELTASGTPGAETLTLLARKTLDLAEMYLLRYGGRLTETKERQGQQVLDWARDVAKGVFVLTGAMTPESTSGKEPMFAAFGSETELDADWGRKVSRSSMSQL